MQSPIIIISLILAQLYICYCKVFSNIKANVSILYPHHNFCHHFHIIIHKINYLLKSLQARYHSKSLMWAVSVKCFRPNSLAVVISCSTHSASSKLTLPYPHTHQHPGIYQFIQQIYQFSW